MRGDLETVDGKLTGERDERCTVEVRLRDSGHEIRRAGPEGRDARTGDTARARHRLGHEPRCRLVPREDELEPGFAEALDEVDDLAAGMAGDVANARGAQPVADQTRDRRLGQTETRSRRSSQAPMTTRMIGHACWIVRPPSSPNAPPAPAMIVRIAPGISGHHRAR